MFVTIRRGLPLTAAAILASLFLFMACTNSPSAKQSRDIRQDSLIQPSMADSAIMGNFSDQTLLHFDSSRIDSFLLSYPDLKPARNALIRFYRDRQFAYAWFDQSGLIEQAWALESRLGNLQSEGVTGKIPYQEAFEDLLSHAARDRNNPPGQPTEAELMLTSQYFYYALKAWRGLPNEDLKDLGWYVPRKQVSYDDLLQRLLSGNSRDSIREPVYRQYALLRSQLEQYRQLEKTPWDVIRIPGKKLQRGDSNSSVIRIRERLTLLGDLRQGTQGTVFDQELDAAVRAFQARHGLQADGVIGPGMLKELNRPISERIRQIAVNMERCRWLPDSQDGYYLAVNIPEYKLHAYHNDSLLFSMNVVVGKPLHKTVVFSGQLKHVVFAPYWNVPVSIFRNEILPSLKRDPGYIARNQMEVLNSAGQVINPYSVNWKQYSGRTSPPYSVRQKPGPHNSLGLVKFLFPNSYSIYLHDSPAKALFNEDQRAFSHGCIRVAEPRKLAEWLLRNRPEWTPDAIWKAMNAGKERYINLDPTIPVYIVYLTSWVDREGKIQFRKDIYDRDERLADRLLN